MHLGTQGPVFFAGLGVVSNLTSHEKKTILMATPSNLIQVGRKITRVFLISWKSRKQTSDANLLLIIYDFGQLPRGVKRYKIMCFPS